MAPTGPRIAYYTWHFPTLSETFVHRELAALKRAGLSVIILAEASERVEMVDRDARSLLADTEYVGGVDPRRIRHYHWRVLRTRPLRYASALLYVMSRRYSPFKGLIEDLALFSRCVHVAAILEGRADHLHSPWADRSAFIVSVTARLLGLPSSVHARAHDVHRAAYRVGLEDRIGHAEFVVTNTRYNAEHVRSFLPASRRSRVVVVYNGLEPARFVPRSGPMRAGGPPRLLCVARLIEQKGLGDLLQACRILEGQGQAFLCDVIGPAEAPLSMNYFVRLMQLHRRLGLAERVRFLGAKPLADVIEHYRQADVFVLPCVIAADGSRDISPNALIEAMAMQLPVVSTTVTGVPEIVETGVSGLLVPPADPEALAGALARLLREPELRRQLGENARLRVEQRFDIDANIATYVRLFRGDIPRIPSAVERGPDRDGRGGR